MNPNNDNSNSSGLDEEFDFMDDQPRHKLAYILVWLICLALGVLGVVLHDVCLTALSIIMTIGIAIWYMIS